MASADNSVQIMVSFSGREQTLPLSVRPSLELPDSKVDAAESQLDRALRQAFEIQADDTIYLHEAITNRILSKETFRDPRYCDAFPRHWYLVVEQKRRRSMNGKGVNREDYNMNARSDGLGEGDALRHRENDLDMSSMVDDVAKIFGLTAESMDEPGGEEDLSLEGGRTVDQHDTTGVNSHHKVLNGPSRFDGDPNDPDDLGDPSLDDYGDYDGNEDGDDVMFPSLMELSPTGNTKYQSHTLHCSADGKFGFTLRHFSIQPNTRAHRSETPHSDRTHSRSDSLTSTDSLDSFRLTTTFIRHVTPGGVAEGAGLEAGLAIQQINGESILRSNGDEIQQLLDQCGDTLSLLVLPKENDDLQCLYPHYTYGEAGSHMTDDGQMFTVDIPVTRGTRGASADHTPPTAPSDQSNTLADHHQTRPNNEQQMAPPTSLNRMVPPSGLVPFNDDGSQELSLGPDHLHSTNSSGDFLLEATLQEIVMRDEALSSKVNNRSHVNNYGGREYENVALGGYTNGEVAHGNSGGRRVVTKRNNLEFTTTTAATTATNLDLISEDAPANHLDNKWYHDSNDSYINSYSNSLAQDPPNKIENTQSSVSDTNFVDSASPTTEGPRPRTRSQSSLQKASGSSCSSETHLLSGRAGLTSSMSALDYLSLSKRSHSTDLGNIRIKKKGRNSLGALTRIGLHPGGGFGASSSKAIKRHRSDENTHRIKPIPQRSVHVPHVAQPREDQRPTRGEEPSSSSTSLPLWMLQSPNAQHRTTPRQQSQASDGGGSMGSNTQLSGGSSEQQQPSIVSSSSASSSYRPLGHSQSTEGKGRRARSYQSQRAKLHSRSSSTKISGSQELTDSYEHRIGRGGRRSMDRSDTSLEGSTSQERSVQSDDTIVEGKATATVAEPSLPIAKNDQQLPPSSTTSIPLTKEQIQRDAVPIRVSTVGRQHSLREAQQNSMIMRPEREKKNRPLSAIEQQQFRHAALQPDDHTHFQAPPTITTNQSNQGKDSKIPLYKTRSAQTPYGPQVFREVNIEEAIARSQMTQEGAETDGMTSLEQPGKGSHHHSNVSKRKEFGKKSAKSVDYAVDNETRNIGGSPLALRLSTEVLATLGFGETAEHFRKDIKCHGILSKKLDITESGKRASDRTWRAHYAVLAGTKLLFYKDKRDAVVHKPSEEPSIDVVPSITTVETNSKKKFVFRIKTAHGAEFLLQADDAPSFSNWVTAIQRMNDGQNIPNESLTSSLTRPESSNKLAAPNSPLMQRRSSSPQPQKVGGKRKDLKFMNRLRRALTGGRPGDQPDSSSFLTFGQSLEDCPVSADNKRVPLVVEFCVREVEEQGLEVEGIYRKPGQVNLIKSMSAEMDKGNYDFSDYGDIHTVGSLLKKFFKELPDPAVPAHLYDDFVACAKEANDEDRLSSLKELVFQLPTAHYHTLKFLMRHLKKVASHSDENKMTYRNVSIVFGPTLLSKPDASQDILSNMNASYVIVQLLCQHVDHLFSPELCGEEQRLQEEATEMMRLREEEIATRGSPTVSRHSETKMQKEQRLAKASPQAVRRIKNNLGSSERVSNGRLGDAKRNSFNEGSLTSLQPKQPNWPKSPTRRISDEYSGSGVGMANSRQLAHHHQQQDNRRQKMKRTHVYEDVESPEPPIIHVSADSHARTRSWVESHNERMWGNDDVSRSDSAEGHRRGEGHRHGDTVGSLWASRNRPEVSGGGGGHHHQTRGTHSSSSSSSSSKERRNHPKMSRLGGGRGHLQTAFAPPPMTVESELLGPSYSRAASLPTSHLTAGLAGTSSRRVNSGTPTKLGSKKISYSMAMAVSPVDMPDKDTPLHHSGRGRREMEQQQKQQQRGERFSTSEQYTSSTTGRVRLRSRDGGEQAWQPADTRGGGGGYGSSSSRSSHAHHQGGHAHHTGMYPRQFNSLQRQLSPPQIQGQPPQHHYTSSSSRRSSESSRDSYGGSYVVQDNQDHYSHYSREAGSRGGGGGAPRIVPQRSYSNDPPHGQRMDGMGPSPIPNRESYL